MEEALRRLPFFTNDDEIRAHFGKKTTTEIVYFPQDISIKTNGKLANDQQYHEFRALAYQKITVAGKIKVKDLNAEADQPPREKNYVLIPHGNGFRILGVCTLSSDSQSTILSSLPQ